MSPTITVLEMAQTIGQLNDMWRERNAKLVAALELAQECIRSGYSEDFPLTRLENETLAAINEALTRK